MIDIETLSVYSNALVVVIGAIKFNRQKVIKSFDEIEDRDKFYMKVDIDHSKLNYDFDINEDVIAWWNTQDKKVRDEALSKCSTREPIDVVLSNFNSWFGDSVNIWGNGDDFDCSILSESYRQCELTPPWKFWNTRDCRTIYDLASIKKSMLPTGNEHHALFDCYRQIVGVQMAIKRLMIYKI